MIETFNTIAAGILSAIAAWAAISPRVRCGIVAQFGLSLISIGFAGLCLMGLQLYTHRDAIAAAQAFVHVGLVLYASEFAHRALRNGPRRRASDWAGLER